MLPGKYIKRGSQNNVQCRMPVEHGLYGSFLNHRNFKVIKDVYFYLEIAKKKKVHKEFYDPMRDNLCNEYIYPVDQCNIF